MKLKIYLYVNWLSNRIPISLCFRYKFHVLNECCGLPMMSLPIIPNALELLPGRSIGEGRQTFIIAEIGQNHNGEITCNRNILFLIHIAIWKCKESFNINQYILYFFLGNLEIAKKLILKAKECGADCVKFQKSR